MLNIQIFPVGMLGTNAYVVTDAATGETAVIDPGFDQPDFAAAVAQADNVTKILLTHGHYDHIGGVAALLSMLNSCASGMSVVNIDNGFGAGYLASMINHMD